MPAIVAKMEIEIQIGDRTQIQGQLTKFRSFSEIRITLASKITVNSVGFREVLEVICNIVEFLS
jgi:hypothetical protein